MREPIQIRYIHYGAVPDLPPYVPTGMTYRPDRNILAACEIAGISIEDARSPSRKREISYRRFHVMAILRSWGRSLPQIGRILNRDHSTILHGLRRWDLIESDASVYTKRPNEPVERNVHWSAKRGKWLVRTWGNNAKSFGAYTDFSEAVRVRDSALHSHVEAA